MEIYRGDNLIFDFDTTLEDGSLYEFKKGDILKVGIKEKLTNPKCSLQKTIEIFEPTTALTIEFTHEEMKKCCLGTKILEIELTDVNGRVYTLNQEELTILGDVIND